jgi:mannan endo-1,4-beta-mannosidase
MTEKELKHEKRKKKLIVGFLGTGGAAVVLFFVIQVAQSLLGTRNGLLAQYYNNINLTGNPVVERVDKNINFIWGNKTPHPRITKGFSARWQGQIILDKSSDYVFTLQSDEGLKFFIDGILLINTWSMRNRPPQSSAKIHLNKGLHEIKLEYFFNQKHAALRLLWSSDYFPRKTVKNKVLYPPGKRGETQ